MFALIFQSTSYSSLVRRTPTGAPVSLLTHGGPIFNRMMKQLHVRNNSGLMQLRVIMADIA